LTSDLENLSTSFHSRDEFRCKFHGNPSNKYKDDSASRGVDVIADGQRTDKQPHSIPEYMMPPPRILLGADDDDITRNLASKLSNKNVDVALL